MIKYHYQLCKAIWIAQGETALDFIDVCYIKQRVTGKQHIQAYFTPQSVKDVSCSILCTVVMANEDSNIWSDGVPGMAGYGHWVRLLCKNPLICLLFGRSRTNLRYDSSAYKQTLNNHYYRCTLFSTQRIMCEKHVQKCNYGKKKSHKQNGVDVPL